MASHPSAPGAFVGMAENADKLQAILRLIKVDVKPGSKWHPVSSAWLRRAQVHAGLEEAHVEDTREAPGKLDNSDIADPIFPMCLRRSAVRFRQAPGQALLTPGHCTSLAALTRSCKIPKTQACRSGPGLAIHGPRATRAAST